MPNYRYCMNCNNDKPVERYADFYCEGCASAAREAEEYAAREGLDAGSAKRVALEARRAGPLDHKHPIMDLTAIRTRAYEARLSIDPADLRDPRRGR